MIQELENNVIKWSMIRLCYFKNANKNMSFSYQKDDENLSKIEFKNAYFQKKKKNWGSSG